jgi:hypothetical protein
MKVMEVGGRLWVVDENSQSPVYVLGLGLSDSYHPIQSYIAIQLSVSISLNQGGWNVGLKVADSQAKCVAFTPSA